ncbi:MAG: CBS domain-containing protein [Acidobacteria bacterium]|nr:CBS domain-containing protein [Acidobacteriota bacterium]
MIIGPFVTQRDIVEVRHDDTLSEAAARMRARRVGSAIVTPPPPGSKFGIITERDILRALADGADPVTARVAAYMTPKAVSITAEWHVVEAATTMVEKGFRHLIVVDDEGRAVGVLSIRDIVRALLHDRQRMAAG